MLGDEAQQLDQLGHDLPLTKGFGEISKKTI